jgi:hypothetical protein
MGTVFIFRPARISTTSTSVNFHEEIAAHFEGTKILALSSDEHHIQA